jgi:hypothetical protein
MLKRERPSAMCIKLLVLLLLVTGQARGQYVVDLANAGTVVAPAGLHVDSVIASFNDSASIGTVLRGPDNDPVPAFLSGGISKGLEGAFRNAPDTRGALHCTMRVNALDLREISNAVSEDCVCALNFELLSSTDSGWVRLFEYAATSTIKGGLDATKRQPASILNAFAKGFAAFSLGLRSGELPSWERIAAPRSGVPVQLDRAYAVLTVGAPARGLYPDFMSFRDQHPDTTVAFTLKPIGKDGIRSLLVKLKTARGRSLPANVWGLSDGRYLYVNMGNRFLQLNRSGNDFKGSYDFEESDSNAGILAAGIAFGLIGAALASASLKHEPVPVHLDMRTGRLLPTPPPIGYGPTSEATSDHLFQYSRDCPMDTTVKVLVYGGLETELTKEGYHVLKLVPRPDLVPVEIQVGDGPPTRVDVSTARTGGEPTVYLIKVDGNGLPTVDCLNPDMAATVLQELDPKHEIK